MCITFVRLPGAQATSAPALSPNRPPMDTHCSLQGLAKFIRAEITLWEKAVKVSGVKIE